VRLKIAAESAARQIWKRFLVTWQGSFCICGKHGLLCVRLGAGHKGSVVSHHLSFLPSASRLSRWLLPAWLILIASCTLTGDDYAPADVDALPVQQPAPAPSAASPDAGVCPGGECSLPEPNGPAPSVSESSPMPEGLQPGPIQPEAMDPSSIPPTCGDQLPNGDETAVDCGGSCTGCADGADCNTDLDCQSGRCSTGRCAPPSCDDGVSNGGEPSVDCGGPCPNCPTGRACSEPGDCQSAVCAAGGCAAGVAQCCQAATCTDGVANADETDVDCGGDCPDCPTGLACDDEDDCQSGVCGSDDCSDGADQCCQAPSCDDGVQNGNEPLVDCGNLNCGLCALGSDCSDDAQCASDFCDDGSCTNPGTCTDGMQNGRETATDCGGGTCPRCGDRLACRVADDCINDNCFGNVCISCGSGVIDGTETDVDCGGADPFCQRCAPGQRCLINVDCASNFCNNGFC
jgi:hypothetical protein